MKIERLFRSVFPSLSKLTFNPFFKLFLRVFDFLPAILFKECRNLPPNHLRIRVGVGNRLFSNQIVYLSESRHFWLYTLSNGLWAFDSTIMDIGVGCGRFAHYLRDYSFLGSRFTGSYIGIDIDQEMLDWCRKHFDRARFRFHFSTDKSVSYHNTGSSSQTYQIPEPDSSIDFIFSTSLYTHLLESEMINYTHETFRLLKPGGNFAAFCFCMDYPPPTLGNRHTFANRVGNAFVESMSQPEAAVAYTAKFLFSMVQEAGFEDFRIVSSPGDWQPMIVARKPS
jgi:ubiquinone/menaquinone biosynthesis C-methylase UbiE